MYRTRQGHLLLKVNCVQGKVFQVKTAGLRQVISLIVIRTSALRLGYINLYIIILTVHCMVIFHQKFTNRSFSFTFDVNKTPPKGESTPAWEEPCIRPPCTWSKNSDSQDLLGGLSMHVFETRTTIGRGHFACLDSGVSQIFMPSISKGEKILGNANAVV